MHRPHNCMVLSRRRWSMSGDMKSIGKYLTWLEIGPDNRSVCFFMNYMKFKFIRASGEADMRWREVLAELDGTAFDVYRTHGALWPISKSIDFKITITDVIGSFIKDLD